RLTTIVSPDYPATIFFGTSCTVLGPSPAGEGFHASRQRAPRAGSHLCEFVCLARPRWPRCTERKVSDDEPKQTFGWRLVLGFAFAVRLALGVRSAGPSTCPCHRPAARPGTGDQLLGQSRRLFARWQPVGNRGWIDGPTRRAGRLGCCTRRKALRVGRP